MMVLLFYFSLYLCPLLCDFKGPSTKRQFISLLFDSEFGCVTYINSHDTESGKST